MARGVFSFTGQRLGKPGAYYDAVLVDLDGDRDLDAILVTAGGNTVWINEGKATFRESRQRIGRTGAETMDLALGDLDGDGDLDVVANRAGPNRLLLNDGKGRFTDSQQALGNWKSRNIAIGSVR